MKAAEKDKKGNPTRIRPLAEQAGTASRSVAPAASGVEVKKVLVPIDFSESSLNALIPSNEVTAESPTGFFAGHLLTTGPPRQPGSYRAALLLEIRLSIERIAREK